MSCLASMRTLAKKVPGFAPWKTQFKTQTLNKFNQFSGRSRFSTIRRFVLTFRERSTSKMFCPWLRFGRSHDLSRRRASVCCFRTHVWFWCHSVSNHPSPMKILENPSLQLFLTLGTCAIWIFRRFFSLGPPKLQAARSEFHRLLQHPSFNPKRPVWAWISCSARVRFPRSGAMFDPQVLRGGKGRSLVRGVMV